MVILIIIAIIVLGSVLGVRIISSFSGMNGFVITTFVMTITILCFFVIEFYIRDNDVKDTKVSTMKIKESGETGSVKITRSGEVFNIGANVFTYPEAHKVCKLYNGRLANKSEMEKAWRKGAHWCDLGWVEGQKAYYPSQHECHGTKDKRLIGIGKKLPPELKLSVNCHDSLPN